MDYGLSDEAASDSENIPKFVESDNMDSLPKIQFKTAEIADAVMGTEAPVDPSDIESLFPKNVKNYQTGFLPPCDEAQCASADHSDGAESSDEPNSEESQQVYYIFNR